MGLFYDRGCVNHGSFRSGCWACAAVTENDRQRRLTREEAERRADRALHEQYAHNARIAKERRRRNRSAAAGIAFNLGVYATSKIVENHQRKKADFRAKLDALPKPDEPASWQPDPLDDSRLRWWDGTNWQRPAQPRPVQQAYPTAEQAYPAAQQAYPTAQQVYLATEQAYSTTEQAYSTTQQAYPATEQAYPADQQVYPTYPAAEQAYPATQQVYPAAEQAYPAGWYPDYALQGQLRYYDGQQWTHHVHTAMI